MNAEDTNVARLEGTGKGDLVIPTQPDEEQPYIGSRVDRDRFKRYNRAWVEGDFNHRSEFIVAACDAAADRILGPLPASPTQQEG